MTDNSTVSTVTTEEGESPSSVIQADKIVLPQIDITALTESVIEGKGTFDLIMKAVAGQLEEQWNSNKITGQEYAAVYTAAITTSVSQAIEFLLQSSKMAYDIQLTKANIEKARADVIASDLNNQRLTAELAKVPVEIELLRKQSLKLDAEILQTNKQVEQLTANISKTPYEISILEKQAAVSEAQKLNTQATTDRIIQETTSKLPLELAILDKEKESMDFKNNLVESQAKLAEQQLELAPVELELKRTQLVQVAKQTMILEREYDIKVGELAMQSKQIDLAGIQIEVQREELKVKMAQVLSQEAQSELYRQKVVSEVAQTDPSVLKVGSVIELNNQVLKGQVDAFKFDKLNRTAKLYLDVFSTTYSIGDRSVNAQNKLTDSDIGKVMSLISSNLGVS